MEFWLSHFITIDTFCSSPIYSRININQTSSKVELHKDFYSSWVDEKETNSYFLLLQDMIPDPMLNVYPIIDFLSSGFLTQYESE